MILTQITRLSNIIFKNRCPLNKFRCSYGACIEKEQRCDGKLDCFDQSDEYQCQKDKGSCQ